MKAKLVENIVNVLIGNGAKNSVKGLSLERCKYVTKIECHACEKNAYPWKMGQNQMHSLQETLSTFSLLVSLELGSPEFDIEFSLIS